MSRLLSKFWVKRRIMGTMVKFNGGVLLQSASANAVLVHMGLWEGWSQKPALLMTR